jgi:hypothetical protein
LEDVVCEIVENRYKLSDEYKITLKAIDPAFGKVHYYLSDLESLINKNQIKMYLKITVNMI